MLSYNQHLLSLWAFEVFIVGCMLDYREGRRQVPNTFLWTSCCRALLLHGSLQRLFCAKCSHFSDDWLLFLHHHSPASHLSIFYLHISVQILLLNVIFFFSLMTSAFSFWRFWHLMWLKGCLSGTFGQRIIYELWSFYVWRLSPAMCKLSWHSNLYSDFVRV